MFPDDYKSINIIHFLARHEKVFVTVDDKFTLRIKEKIILKYGSLKNYADAIQMEVPAFLWAFKKMNGHQLMRILRMCDDAGVARDDFYQQITGYYAWGSHNRPVYLGKYISLDPFFLEGYALYVAEGDTGYSGVKKPRKLRLTNSEPDVINFFTSWLSKVFPALDYYILAILPPQCAYEDNLNKIVLRNKKIRVTRGKYNKRIKYRVCMDNSIAIDLMLDLREKVRLAALQNNELAAAYVRGIMIGEGTVYDNCSKYVRIEMKNPGEIEFVRNLFEFLSIACTHHKRINRESMESLYVGGQDNIKRYYDLVGFGCHSKRQEKLTKLVLGRIDKYKS